MHRIVLFGEDIAHRQVIGALVQRLAGDFDLDVRLDWRNATRGYGQVVREFNTYLRDLERHGDPSPDLLIVATDANCKDMNARIRDFGEFEAPAPIIHAVPDPHIKRWLLLNGAAFKSVFGRGCDAPDRKCNRDRYKQRSWFKPSSRLASLPTSVEWNSLRTSWGAWISGARSEPTTRSGVSP